MTNTMEIAMSRAGLVCKDALIADDAIRRFHVDGDRPGSKNGWYVLFGGDVSSGAFGSWKTGEKHTWCELRNSELTPEQRRQHRQRIQQARQARDEQDRLRHKQARTKAQMIWDVSSPASKHHPYLLKKHVECYGLRLHKGALVIPMHDADDCMHSLQFIDTDGNKRFLSGGRKKGCHFMIGSPSETLCIAEGYATAATLHKSTGYAVAVAFDAGNMMSVAKSLRAKHPDINITICADNDADTQGNPGVAKAREAAVSINASLAIPPCAGDFNDLYCGGIR